MKKISEILKKSKSLQGNFPLVAVRAISNILGFFDNKSKNNSSVQNAQPVHKKMIDQLTKQGVIKSYDEIMQGNPKYIDLSSLEPLIKSRNLKAQQQKEFIAAGGLLNKNGKKAGKDKTR